MMAKEIAENNKLINTFMGFEVYEDDRYGKMYPDPSRFANPVVVGMKYDTSWDWIVPVIIKINKLGFNVEPSFRWNGTNSIYVCSIDRIWWESQQLKSETICGRSNITSSILATYECVVSFIEWHNARVNQETVA